MANRRYNTQVAQPRGTDRVKKAGGGMGGRSGEMMYSRGQGVNMRSKRVPTELMDRGAMKKGGKVLKPVPAGKKGLSKLPTQVRNKMGFMKRGGRVNTSRNEGLTLDKAKKANEEIKLDRFKKKRKEQSDKPKTPLGGGVRGSDKSSDIYSRIKQRKLLKKIRKNFKKNNKK